MVFHCMINAKKKKRKENGLIGGFTYAYIRDLVKLNQMQKKRKQQRNQKTPI